MALPIPLRRGYAFGLIRPILRVVMDGIAATLSPAYPYGRRVAGGQLAALAAAASAALAASAADATLNANAHPLAALGRPAPELGRGEAIDTAA
jgi:hypothetical protein